MYGFWLPTVPQLFLVELSAEPRFAVDVGFMLGHQVRSSQPSSPTSDLGGAVMKWINLSPSFVARFEKAPSPLMN